MAANSGNRLKRGHGARAERHQTLSACCAQGHETAAVFFDHDLVARAECDVEFGVFIQVFKPDLAGFAATGDADDGDIGVDCHATRPGQHARQCAGRGFDRIDARPGGLTGNRHGRANPGGTGHGDLRVRCLVFQLTGDRESHAFGRLPCGQNPAGIGNVDIALAIDLDFVQIRDALAVVAKQRVVLDVFKDGDRQGIASGNHVRPDHTCVQEGRAEADCRFRRRDPRDFGRHGDDMGVALPFYRPGQDLLGCRTRPGQTARAHNGYGSQKRNRLGRDWEFPKHYVAPLGLVLFPSR